MIKNKYTVVTGLSMISMSLAPFCQTVQADESYMVEEVVVTAQKREQNLEDVPISMSVVGDDELEKTGAASLRELQQVVPNFSFDAANGYDNISIRGVGGGGRNIGFDTRAGLYIDGVYIGQSAALSSPLFDLERVEVLRGPQGHLFGRNTVSGAVSLVTKVPSEEAAAYVKVVAGTEGTQEIHASFEGAMSETVLGRLSVASQKRDGFVKNQFDDSDLDDLDRQVIRGKLLFDISDNLSVDLNADYSVTDTSILVGEPISNPALGDAGVTGTPREVNFNTTPGSEHDLGGSSVTVDYDLDNGLMLTAVTGYRTAEQVKTNDTDFSPLDYISIDYTDASRQFSQEVRIASPSEESIRYVAGIYFLDEAAKTDRVATLGTFAGPGAGYHEVIDSEVDTKTSALFASADIDMTESLTLNLGARFTDETKDVDYSLVNNGGGASLFGLAVVPSYTDSRSESHMTPTIGVTYAVNDNSNVYAKYSTGFKSGGFNVDYLTDASFAEIEFDTEEVISYELGLKGKSESGKVSYDLVAFTSTYEDFQILQFVEVAPGVHLPILRNAAEVDSQGLEASVKVHVDENLSLGANVGLLKAEFSSFPNGNAAGDDLSGSKLPNAPEITAAVTLDYYIPMPTFKGGIDFYFEYSYRDESYSLADNQDQYLLDSHGLLSTRITFTPEDETWSASLWARNLTDEEYKDYAGNDFLATDFVRYGAPRTVGLEATLRF